ncbi:GTPase required for pre-60S ribosomal subunit nuclear export and maturation, partial [Gonapodya sp. JEL0774]
DPDGTRCRLVERRLKKESPHKHIVFVLNKCDLVPTWVTARWVKVLSAEYPTLAFHASLKNAFGKGDLITLLRQFAKLHADKKQISVGFIGYPNAGKSSIINALRSAKVCTVAPLPGETKIWQYITLTKRIYLIDCPGIVPPSSEMTDAEIVLRGVVRVENVAMPEQYVEAVVQRCGKGYLERTYGVAGWETAEEFLEMVAKKGGKLLKGGEADISTVAKMVLNDWLRGKIPFFTPPPSAPGDKPATDGESKAIADSPAEPASETANGAPVQSFGTEAIKQQFSRIRVTSDYLPEDRKAPADDEDLEDVDGSTEKAGEEGEEDNDSDSNGDNEEKEDAEPSWEDLVGAVTSTTVDAQVADKAKGKSRATETSSDADVFNPQMVSEALKWAETELDLDGSDNGEDNEVDDSAGIPVDPTTSVKDAIALEAETFLANTLVVGVKPPKRSRAPAFVVKDQAVESVPETPAVAGKKRKAASTVEVPAPATKRRNVKSTSSTEKKPQPAVEESNDEPDSELELSDADDVDVPAVESDEKAASEDIKDVGDVTSRRVSKEKRMTTNKKKVGTHYYEKANVKNRNRDRKSPEKTATGVNAARGGKGSKSQRK